MRKALAGLVLLTLVAPVAPAAAQDPVRALELVRVSRPRAAPAFTVPTPDGGTISLAAFRGRIVFLNFWATWCAPCKEEMPAMERLYRRFKDRGLVMLALSTDAGGADDVRSFVARERLTFPVGLDPRMIVAGLYAVWALPSTFVIDRQGVQVLFASGPRNWDSPEAHTLFESLLRR